VLIGRSGAATPEARSAIAALQGRGIKVHAAACDVTDRAALSIVLAEISVSLPPLRGIVHAAAVIEDGLIHNMSRDQIRRVCAPKMLGAHYLHELTVGRKLDFFILFSSATTLFGNPGQGNYVAANAYLEGFAAARRASGLPALCVRWGAIDDAGFLARNQQVKEALQGRMGGAALASHVALDVLEKLLLENRSGLGVLEFDWRALNRFLPTANSPKFREIARSVEDAAETESGGEDVRSLLGRMDAAELTRTFIAMLKKEVGDILRISPDRIDEDRVLHDMGLDSLMGVELATAVEARFAVRLPVMALNENPTIARLSAKIIAELTGSEEAAGEPQDRGLAEQARQIVSRHADETYSEVIARTAEELESADFDATGRMIN
jgi:phthiocerol/phenolphthiocerol synthesis type-I polyketide synthase C